MNTMITLAKREFWENRGGFFKAPVVFGGFILLIAICYLILLCTHVTHYSINGQIDASGNIPPALTADIFYGMSLPFMIVLWIIAFNYFLKCLSEDRQDRSLLFWQSMPISDWETILSKAVAGTVVISFCTWVCIVVTEFIFLIIVTIAAGAMGLGNIVHLWNPATLIVAWLHILGALYLQALWLFPIFGWCMLCSAFAKKSPFITAIIPIICLFIIEHIFFQKGYISSYVASRFHLAIQAWDNLMLPISGASVNNNLTPQPGFLDHLLFTHSYGYISLYWSLVVGAGFMAIAGYLRYANYHSDN